MFKSARWRSDKNKVKVEFKLQFHAAKVPQIGEDELVISVVPADSGKPSVKSDRVIVRDGNCFWENPLYETVRFNRDPKTGKIHPRIYCFVIGTGLSKAGVIGEACIDLSNYVETTNVSLVSLPLKNSKSESVLHVSIQRTLESNDQREFQENENGKLTYKDHSLKPQFGNGELKEILKSNSQDMGLETVSQIAQLNGNCRASSGSDVTMSSSESSSGVEVPWQPHMKSDCVLQEPLGILSSPRSQRPRSDMPTAAYVDHQRSQWEWLGNSVLEASTDDSSGTPRENLLRQQLDESQETSEIVTENLKSDVAALSRQAEMSELELQTLRKQIVKESKRSQDLFRELACLKEERDALKGECEKLKSLQRCRDDANTETDMQFHEGGSMAIIEELRRELNHAIEINSHLQTQLQKTQETVRELDGKVEQKNGEILDLSNRTFVKELAAKLSEAVPIQLDDDNDDEETKALEELVKDHRDAKEAYLLEQQIMDMRSEIEIFRRDKDELEMQLEQLALDYEIMKQENHDMAYKLEQSQIQEQLKMQYECSSSYADAHEFETQIVNLENELKRQTEESADSLVRISELDAHVKCVENELKRQTKESADALVRIKDLKAYTKCLEEELEKQSLSFEADLEALTCSKIEQEKRAIRAEETLRKTRWQNADTAERLQEEFRRLSLKMASTFAANERLATKALAESNELRLQKIHLEEMVQKSSEERHSIKGEYEARLVQLTSQMMSMTDQIEKMQSEIEDKVLQLEHQRTHANETQRNLLDENLKLKNENTILSEEIRSKEILMRQLEQTRISMEEMELLVKQGNEERSKLENKIMLANTEAEEWHKELNKMRCLVEEKELIAVDLQLELDSLHMKYMELKHSVIEEELEQERLGGHVFRLESDLTEREEEFNSLGNKIKGCNSQGATIESVEPIIETSEYVTCGCNEVADLQKRIKLHECQIKLKEHALETSSKAFLEKEKDLHNKVEEVGGRVEMLSHSDIQHPKNGVKNLAVDLDPSFEVNEEAANNDHSSSTMIKPITVDGHIESSLKSEMALLRERNKSAEEELNEMQKRYSELSLKCAEVEGERQQLAMKVRYLKSAKKRS